jgi:hypothetical protein
VAHYLVYATKGGTSRPQQMLAQVHGMLEIELWGVPTGAQLADKFLPGDGLVVAVGAPYRWFVGDAVLASRYREFADAERAGLPPGLEFDHGVTLRSARVWSNAVPIDDVWATTIAAETNPKADFLRSIYALRSDDAALIVRAGTRGLAVLDELAAGEADPEAEDDKIVALMNSRRTNEGKPLLTAAQEQQVRENRRSQRTPRHT